VEKDIDDEDDGEEASGDKEEGAREDINSRPVEESIGGLGHKLDALGHHGQQGEGRPHLVLVHQLRHDGVGDLLDRPVEGVEHANKEKIGEATAKAKDSKAPGSACQGEGKEDQGCVLEEDQKDWKDQEICDAGSDCPGRGKVGVVYHVDPILQSPGKVPEGTLAIGREVEYGKREENSQQKWSAG